MNRNALTKTSLAAAALALSLVFIGQPVSAAEQISRKTRTEATGRILVYPNSVSSCSDPGVAIGLAMGSSMITVRSEMTYRSCREYRQYEVQVTGSSWNSKETEIQGTSRLLYQSEETRDGSSRTLYNPEGVDLATYLLARSAVISECSNKKLRAEMNATQAAQLSNPCAR